MTVPKPFLLRLCTTPMFCSQSRAMWPVPAMACARHRQWNRPCSAPLLHTLEPTLDFDSSKLPRRPFNRSPQSLPDPCQQLNALPYQDSTLFPFVQTSLHQDSVSEGIFNGSHHSSQLAKARVAGAFCAQGGGQGLLVCLRSDYIRLEPSRTCPQLCFHRHHPPYPYPSLWLERQLRCECYPWLSSCCMFENTGHH